MKIILEQYGKMLLDALVFGLLLVFILTEVEDAHGNKGAFRIIGAQLHEETNAYGDYIDFDVYETDSYKIAPVITYEGGAGISIGECQLTALIKAVGADGTEIPIKVYEVKDQNGRELLIDDDAKVYFDAAGIYIVKVKAVDSIKRETACTIKIPVNKG